MHLLSIMTITWAYEKFHVRAHVHKVVNISGRARVLASWKQVIRAAGVCYLGLLRGFLFVRRGLGLGLFWGGLVRGFDRGPEFTDRDIEGPPRLLAITLAVGISDSICPILGPFVVICGWRGFNRFDLQSSWGRVWWADSGAGSGVSVVSMLSSPKPWSLSACCSRLVLYPASASSPDLEVIWSCGCMEWRGVTEFWSSASFSTFEFATSWSIIPVPVATGQYWGWTPALSPEFVRASCPWLNYDLSASRRAGRLSQGTCDNMFKSTWSMPWTPSEIMKRLPQMTFSMSNSAFGLLFPKAKKV